VAGAVGVGGVDQGDAEVEGARRMVATDSCQSAAPYTELIPMQPSPWADVVKPAIVIFLMVVIFLSRATARQYRDLPGE
jgi:hypothetical protein